MWGQNLSFTLFETVSLLGLFQSFYVFVYILLRSDFSWRSLIPQVYFLVLSNAVFIGFLKDRSLFDNHLLEILSGVSWFLVIPMSCLLIDQLVLPPKFWVPNNIFVIVSIPILILFSYIFSGLSSEQFYTLTVLVSCCCLLSLCFSRGIFSGDAWQGRYGRERYWLVIALVVFNILLILNDLLYASHILASWQLWWMRLILGVGIVYVSGTAILRIYPQAFVVTPPKMPYSASLSDEELQIAERFKQLLEREKIYLDSSIGRAEIAQELSVTETALSRIVNQVFKKNIPQILNEMKVLDAQTFLQNKDMTIQSVFEESGFNSLSSFNRVFREITGQSPSEYRANIFKRAE